METLTQQESGLMTVAEVAHVLRLKESTIRQWVLERRIPYCKPGGKAVRIRREVIERMISETEIPAKEEK
jgi:excisionase family DNA binding protein